MLPLPFLVPFFCFPAKGTKPEMKTGLDDIKITEGNELRLQCSFTSVTECKVSWLKDDQVITSGDRVVLKERKDGSSLTIKSVKLEDSGKYTFEVSNEFGDEKSSCNVEVDEFKESPAFISKLKVVQVAEGKDAEFEVQVKGTPHPTIEWYKGDQKIEHQDRYEISEPGNNKCKLLIKNCKISDKGRVRCIAKNIAGEKSCWADLLIQQKIGPPRIDIIGDLEREIDGETDIVLEAEVTGKPKPKIEWSKNGKPLMWSSRKCEVKAIGDRQTLRIIRAAERDIGEYKLTANSSAGREVVAFVVKKKGQFVVLILSFQF